MDAFRGEYEKLFSALEKSHKNEKRLNTKCQELGSEIANQQSRVDAAKEKTHEDQVIITTTIMNILIHLALKTNNSMAFRYAVTSLLFANRILLEVSVRK